MLLLVGFLRGTRQALSALHRVQLSIVREQGVLLPLSLVIKLLKLIREVPVHMLL